MNDTAKFDEWALHAYLDGEVCGEQCREIEAYLASDPHAAQQVDDWRQQRLAMKRAFDPVLDEPLPASLSATLRSGGSWRSRPYMAAAAAIMLLMLGGVFGWFLAHEAGTPGQGAIAAHALDAHRIYTAEVRHPVEVAGSERAHLQTWLSKRVGTAFVIPDLSAEGYTLLGGRLLVSEGRPAAQLMFEDQNRKRITVFLTSHPTNTETAIRVEVQGPLIACYWLDGKLGFVVAGEMDRAAMMKLADVIYEQLEG